VPQLAAVAQGNLLPAATADVVEQQALARGILLAASRAVGAPGDSAKAEQILKSSGGKIPRATFSLAMARTLFESAQLYSRQQIKDTEKMTILCPTCPICARLAAGNVRDEGPDGVNSGGHEIAESVSAYAEPRARNAVRRRGWRCISRR
jgi:hypothetical protein